MKRPISIVKPLIIALGTLLGPALGWGHTLATVESYREPIAQRARTPSPSDFMPWYAVPDRYLFSGSYNVKLTITEMQIDHLAYDSRCSLPRRNYMIAASFGHPIGHELFSGTVELPLLAGDRLEMSRMAPAAVGDYVLRLSGTPLFTP